MLYRWNENQAGPSLDPLQNIMNISTTRSGNSLTISFTRPLISPDTSGRDENLDVCRNVLWAFGGTTTFDNNGNVAALTGHSDRGVFANQLCLCTSSKSNQVILYKVCIDPYLQVEQVLELWFLWP